MPSIPISQEVQVIPNVVGTGGNPLALNTVVLTQNHNQPMDSILTFYNSADVGDYFGLSSIEYMAAVVYFKGFNNCTAFPSAINFAGYSAIATSAFVVSTSQAGKSLADYQALRGSFSVSADGVAYVGGIIDLASATSLGGNESTSVINLIKTDLGWTSGSHPTITWDSLVSRFKITSYITGAASHISSIHGTLATSLGLFSGATNGGDPDTPTTAMERIKGLTTNWATFFTLWEVLNSDAVLFAQWTAAQNDAYLYIAHDSDPLAVNSNYTAGLGALMAANQFDGVICLWTAQNSFCMAAAVAGVAASMNWSALNGRATLKFRQQEGLESYIPPVTSQAIANNLIGNGYTYYGTYSAPGIGNVYNIFADGALAGSRFKWFDTYIGQIFLNSQLGLAIFEGLLQINLAPYNEVGNTFIRMWCADPISKAVNAGIIRTGVNLSNAQIAATTNAIGIDVSKNLQTNGYYLHIGIADAQTRGSRQSPPVSLYYTDGGAIQKITLNSIVVL